MTKTLDIAIDRLNGRFQMKAYIFENFEILGSLDGYTDNDTIFNCLVSLEVKRLIKFARALQPGIDVTMTNVSADLDDKTQTEVYNVITAAKKEIAE